MPPQGSGVQFENQGQEFGRPPVESGFDITGKLVSWGLVSSRTEAQYVMIGVIVLAFAGAAFFFFGLGGNSAPPSPPPNMAPAASYQ